jgi:hypothetical protein
MGGLASSVPARVRENNTTGRHVSIICRWAKAERGMEVLARNVEPDGVVHLWHRVTVDFGKLRCNCKSFETSRYSATTPKACSHLTGNNGLDGVAGWLELESQQSKVGFRMQAYLSASHKDLHRVTARMQMALDEMSRANEEAAAAATTIAEPEEDGRAGNRQADASRGVTLESLFTN